MSDPDTKIDASSAEFKNRIPLETAILLMNHTLPDIAFDRFLEIAQIMAPAEVEKRYQIIIPDKEKVAQGKAKSKAVYTDSPHAAVELLEIIGEKLRKLHPKLYKDAPERAESMLMDSFENEDAYTKTVQEWTTSKGTKYGTEVSIKPSADQQLG